VPHHSQLSANGVILLSQANATAAILASDAMQQACGKLCEELAAVDSLAKEVHDLRNRVEQLEAQVSAKLRS